MKPALLLYNYQQKSRQMENFRGHLVFKEVYTHLLQKELFENSVSTVYLQYLVYNWLLLVCIISITNLHRIVSLTNFGRCIHLSVFYANTVISSSLWLMMAAEPQRRHRLVFITKMRNVFERYLVKDVQ